MDGLYPKQSMRANIENLHGLVLWCTKIENQESSGTPEKVYAA
jgi:hypothetical protein